MITQGIEKHGSKEGSNERSEKAVMNAINRLDECSMQNVRNEQALVTVKISKK